jgi:hypothetical protein
MTSGLTAERVLPPQSQRGLFRCRAKVDFSQSLASPDLEQPRIGNGGPKAQAFPNGCVVWKLKRPD